MIIPSVDSQSGGKIDQRIFHRSKANDKSDRNGHSLDEFKQLYLFETLILFIVKLQKAWSKSDSYVNYLYTRFSFIK